MIEIAMKLLVGAILLYLLLRSTKETGKLEQQKKQSDDAAKASAAIADAMAQPKSVDDVSRDLREGKF